MGGGGCKGGGDDCTGHSLASPIPSGLMANIASDSGRQGESYILHILVSPRPFLK